MIITVSRLFGSGGSEVAARVAQLQGAVGAPPSAAPAGVGDTRMAAGVQPPTRY